MPTIFLTKTGKTKSIYYSFDAHNFRGIGGSHGEQIKGKWYYDILFHKGRKKRVFELDYNKRNSHIYAIMAAGNRAISTGTDINIDIT